MTKLRVLHIVTYMGLGGLETMLMNYYRKIDREKMQFDFLVHRTEKAYYDEEIESLGGRIYRFSRLNPFSPFYKAALKDFFISHPEYKIVHVHQDCLSGVILKVAKECGVTVRIAHAHSDSQDKNLKYPIKLFFRRNIPKFATHLLSCGQQAGEWMFSGAKFEILNNSIEASKYTFSQEKRIEMRKTLGIDDEKFVVGHVGRFSDAKNHSFLLDVFYEISKKRDALLLLVGDGELRGKIEKKIQKLDMSNKVLLLGRRNDVHDIMQAMDVFIFPSKYEGMGIAVIEAQAAGLPSLISSNVPSEAIITDLVQTLPLQTSIDSWAQKAINLTSLDRKNTFEQIKDNGYDINTCVKQLEKFYFNLSE